MKDNKFPGKIERHVTPRQRRHRIGATAVGLGLTTGLIGFGVGTAVGAHGMVPEAVGTCLGPVTHDEIEGGIGGLQDTLGTEKIKVESESGASIESEAAKNLREQERFITTGISDETVPVLLDGDTYTAEDVAERTCIAQPGAQFIAGSGTSHKDI